MIVSKELTTDEFPEDCGMLCATQVVAGKIMGLLKMKSMLDAQKAVALE